MCVGLEPVEIPQIAMQDLIEDIGVNLSIEVN
jgi:hypothetical protein